MPGSQSGCHLHIVRKRACRPHGATALHKAYWLPCVLVSLEELKQDVSSFRFEILNNMKTLKKEREQDLISLKEEQKAIHQKLDLIMSVLQRHPVVLGSDQEETTEISEL